MSSAAHQVEGLSLRNARDFDAGVLPALDEAVELYPGFFASIAVKLRAARLGRDVPTRAQTEWGRETGARV